MPYTSFYQFLHRLDVIWFRYLKSERIHDFFHLSSDQFILDPICVSYFGKNILSIKFITN